MRFTPTPPFTAQPTPSDPRTGHRLAPETETKSAPSVRVNGLDRGAVRQGPTTHSSPTELMRLDGVGASGDAAELSGEALSQALAPTWVGERAEASRGTPDGSAITAASDDPDEVPVGTVVGSFQIVRKLAQGGMGSVYLARHESIGSQVAVKFLHPHLAVDPRLVARFYAEARAVNLIAHQNIVSIFDMGVLPPSRHYLVMEYLEGQTLGELAGPLAPGVMIPILAQVCDALAAAHRQHIVHRDLKPDNIHLIRRGGSDAFVKLLDFGVARLEGGMRATSSVGLILGTPEYMAPEQSLSTRVDGRSDLYALGVIAFQLATGRLPFSGGPNELLAAHREKAPPHPRTLNPDIPEVLAELILCALAKRPEDRFQTADAFKAALLDVLGEKRTPPPSRPAPAPELEASFADSTGRELSRLRCIQLSRGGMFACTEEPLPPLFSRLNAVVRVDGAEWRCAVEVVRHGRAAEMASWGMPAGFGVQFVDAPAELKEAISRMLLGAAAPRTPARGTPLPPKDDPAVARALAELLSRESLDPYAVLDLPRNVSMEDVRLRARTERRRLEAFKERPLADHQQEKLARCLEQVDWAAALLGHPARRARHDAGIGNFRGVARCILAGLSLQELEALRSRFLAENRGLEAKATVFALTAASFESQGQHDKALEQYELALALDPLRLELHQRYSKLMRQEEARRHREAVAADALGAPRPAVRPGVASRGLPLDGPRAGREPTE